MNQKVMLDMLQITSLKTFSSKNPVKKPDQKEKEYSAYISNLGAICIFNLMI